MDINGDANKTQPDALESVVTAIWESTLGIKPIRLDEDFLDIGGDSIAALMIVGRVRQMFNVEIPLPIFFDYITILVMSDMIAEALRLEGDREQ